MNTPKSYLSSKILGFVISTMLLMTSCSFLAFPEARLLQPHSFAAGEGLLLSSLSGWDLPLCEPTGQYTLG